MALAPKNIIGKSYFRANTQASSRVTIIDDKTMTIETLCPSGYKTYTTPYFLVAHQRWPFTIVKDSLRDEAGNSVTDPVLYENGADEFNHDETIVMRFDCRGLPINWTRFDPAKPKMW